MTTTRLLVLTLVASGGVACCTALTPVALEGSESRFEPNGEPALRVPLPQAPAPRTPGDPLPPPPRELSERPRKPWPELIVGEWLRVHDKRIVGDILIEFTRDGKARTRYSYPARPNHPQGIERSTREYRVNENILFAPSAHDDGTWVTETTTFIESLSENNLATLSVTRTRKSLNFAKSNATARGLPLETVLAEVAETQQRSSYVRIKDRDR